MGLVRKATEDNLAAEGGGIDISSILRQAVTAEIERQRQESDAARDDDKATPPD